MEKKEMLAVVDSYQFQDEALKKAFLFFADYLFDIKEDVCKVKNTVEQMEWISIINGNKDGLPTSMRANDFHQAIYNRLGKAEEALQKKQDKVPFREMIKNVNWWVAFLINIFVIISILLLWIGQNKLFDKVTNLPGVAGQ